MGMKDICKILFRYKVFFCSLFLVLFFIGVVRNFYCILCIFFIKDIIYVKLIEELI